MITEQQREISYKIIIALLCAVYGMIVLSMSTQQIKNTFHEISRN